MVNAKLTEELSKLRLLVANTTATLESGGDADTGEDDPARIEFMSKYAVT